MFLGALLGDEVPASLDHRGFDMGRSRSHAFGKGRFDGELATDGQYRHGESAAGVTLRAVGRGIRQQGSESIRDGDGRVGTCTMYGEDASQVTISKPT
jgi:hypothetical protein